MIRVPVFASFLRWLSSTEMFARPAKQLPGKWQLYEFYTEPEGQLVNLKEDAMERSGYLWEITFEREGQLYQNMNLPECVFYQFNHGAWHISRNFVVLSPAENPSEKEEFQFAVKNSTLKMLKKDAEGQIQFFGFFRRIED